MKAALGLLPRAPWRQVRGLHSGSIRNVDVAVIGGGVVGCAVLRSLTLHGYKAILLERLPALAASLASGGNSGIACTAADTSEGSLERKCLLNALGQNADVYRRLNIPNEPKGSLYVAWSDDELKRLESLAQGHIDKGEPDILLLNKEELRAMEPGLSTDALGAMHVQGEVLVDPWLVPIAWAHHALENGAMVELGCAVSKATLKASSGGGVWQLDTSKGTVDAKLVINCGGLWADEVEQLQRPTPFQMRPKRGDYIVFADPGRRILHRPVGQVPRPDYRGVYVWQTLHGNIVCGPTAEFQDSRETAVATDAIIAELRSTAVQAVPALESADVLTTYSGLRPATEFSDYQIESSNDRRWITVGGIRSTGLTASLGIGQYVLDLVHPIFEQLGRQVSSCHPEYSKWTPLPELDSIYASFRERGDGCVDIHGMTHRVTHPIAKIGYEV